MKYNEIERRQMPGCVLFTIEFELSTIRIRFSLPVRLLLLSTFPYQLQNSNAHSFRNDLFIIFIIIVVFLFRIL